MELILIPLNFLAFTLYGYDKLQAQNRDRRIPEKVLLTLSFLGGIGALLGMRFFRHKTRHKLFWLVTTLGAFFNLWVLVSTLTKPG